MPREKITRRQKDLSRLFREKKQINREKLKSSRKKKKFKLPLILAAILVLSLISCDMPGPKNYNAIRVRRVIDGDTLELEDRQRVRLIGIDTPESRYNSKLKRDAQRTSTDYKTIISILLSQLL